MFRLPPPAARREAPSSRASEEEESRAPTRSRGSTGKGREAVWALGGAILSHQSSFGERAGCSSPAPMRRACGGRPPWHPPHVGRPPLGTRPTWTLQGLADRQTSMQGGPPNAPATSGAVAHGHAGPAGGDPLAPRSAGTSHEAAAPPAAPAAAPSQSAGATEGVNGGSGRVPSPPHAAQCTGDWCSTPGGAGPRAPALPRPAAPEEAALASWQATPADDDGGGQGGVGREATHVGGIPGPPPQPTPGLHGQPQQPGGAAGGAFGPAWSQAGLGGASPGGAAGGSLGPAASPGGLAAVGQLVLMPPHVYQASIATRYAIQPCLCPSPAVPAPLPQQPFAHPTTHDACPRFRRACAKGSVGAPHIIFQRLGRCSATGEGGR